jgi:hypothetical protein
MYQSQLDIRTCPLVHPSLSISFSNVTRDCEADVKNLRRENTSLLWRKTFAFDID